MMRSTNTQLCLETARATTPSSISHGQSRISGKGKSTDWLKSYTGQAAYMKLRPKAEVIDLVTSMVNRPSPEKNLMAFKIDAITFDLCHGVDV